MRVLAVNTGSSSLKLSVVDEDDAILEQANIEDWDGVSGLDVAQDWAFDAIGHRVVHGGPYFAEAAMLSRQTRDRLESLIPLAPLHQPRALQAIGGLRQAFPEVPDFAAFDTAFHLGMPEAAATYAVPRHWQYPIPLRRYGAHGLSHSYAARRAADLLDRDPTALRVVNCHVGSGASLCAIRGGRSVDTTMGFTPLEGLMMATRSGTVDPGLVLWLIGQGNLTSQQVQEGLEQHGGLLALAGTTDLGEVVSRSIHGDQRATTALATYVHRLVREAGSMVASLAGVDVLVFTGGVGQNTPLLRERTCEALAWLGIDLDLGTNATTTVDGVVSAPSSKVTVLVLQAREDVEVARAGRNLLQCTAQTPVEV